ncbi:MAG: hypothetical protein V4598_00715 [Bdellovibrionota bacterium]
MHFLILLFSANLFSAIPECNYLGGQMLSRESKLSYNREECQGQLVLFLKDHSKDKAGVIIHHHNVRKLTGKERMEDTYICYKKGHPEKSEFFYGIFDFAKSGTVVKGPGKLVAAWTANEKTRKIEPLDQKYLDEILCQEEVE